MDCDHTQELLHPYLDGELDLLRSLEMEKHMESCRSCAAAHGSYAAVREAIQSAQHYFRAPGTLESRVRAAIGPVPAARPRRAAPELRWLAAAACLIVIAAAGWMLARYLPGGGRTVEAEILAGHIRSLMPGHLTDVLSSDNHTVKPWFNGRVDFSPRVVDLAGAGFPLTGGRLDYIGGRPVAVLVYQRRQHIINVFVWPVGGASQREFQTSAAKGYNSVRWIRDGLEYWAISDLNAAELRQFAGHANMN